MKRIAALAAFGLMPLAACSSGPQKPSVTASSTADGLKAGAEKPHHTASMATGASATLPTASRTVLGLEGIGALRIGKPVPEDGSWAERGAQESDSCRTVSSPDYPGVYAIVADGAVRRITLGRRATVKLAEGIGTGASEADVKKWFAGFREEPDKYEDPPAKYLTAPNARAGEPAVRFEIGADGRVNLIHVGEMPVLAYVEGCS